MDKIIVKGARQHNLKNISVEIPKNKLVVITGISGSGKSSLAFDTIYAEGQRRYVESLSAYARQFLGIMDKPEVDSIDGLSPAISIDQKTTSHNPRSTVGTITEIYDYFRLLFARIGHPHCPKCGHEISKMSTDEIVEKVIDQIRKKIAEDKIKPHFFKIVSPIVRNKKGEFKDLFENLMSKGYSTLYIDNKETTLDNEINLIKTNRHTIEAVIDKVTVSYKEMKNEIFLSNIRSRLSNSIEQSLNLSDGLVVLKTDREEHLYSERFSCPVCNISLPELEPRIFSFNSPIGACTKCRGIGTVFAVDEESILNPKLSIIEGGILPFNKLFFHETWYVRLIKRMCEEEGIDIERPIGELSPSEIKTILHGTDKTYRVPGFNRHGNKTVIYEKYDGVVAELQRRYYNASGDFAVTEIQKYMREEICPLCQGAKLKKEVLAVTVDDMNISQFCDHPISYLTDYFDSRMTNILGTYDKQIAGPIVKEIKTRMKFLDGVGLSYLTISRAAKTLSGGELQRIRLASQIGTGLTGVLYVLDEPSIGLHPKDVSSLIASLKNLQSLGNTLIIVEHDRETIEAADYLIELGPKAGKSGGKLVFSGNKKQVIMDKKSLTGAFIRGEKMIKIEKKPLNKNLGKIKVIKAREHNLKNITVELPLGNLICVTGVSGSGKSTLVVETIYPAIKHHVDGYFQGKMGDFERMEGQQYIDRVYLVDQTPIGRTPRSNPATYVGFFDEIRTLFSELPEAKEKGFEKGRFSFNVKGGRCEKCQGAGVIKIEMQFLSDVYVTCDVCQGKRYNKETLEVKYKGKSISEILHLTVSEAVDFFRNHYQIFSKLQFLEKTGLGYLELGQPAPTLSGGEAQRLKLATELSKKSSGRTLYILDEPTTGLHFYDIQKLLVSLSELVSRGNTVIVIEHNIDVIKNCQYIVDLGPEGGDSGGNVVYQGEVSGIGKAIKSHTAKYLK